MATSTGLVCIYSFELDSNQVACIRLMSSIKVADPSVLVLSVAWSSSFTHHSTVAVSLSNGRIGVFDSKILDDPVRYIQAHSLEAWTVAWSAISDVNLHPSLYSGGDDSAFCKHRATYNPSGEKMNDETLSGNLWETVSSDMKTHTAGVTAILYLANQSLNSETIVTGSYDEYVRVLACEPQRQKLRVLAEKRLGGGVWRLKLLKSELYDTSRTYKILASCMHAGPMILGINCSVEEDWTISITAHFEGHKSMNYATDALEQKRENGVISTTCVSTSFYDKKLCVWNVTGS